MKILNLFLILSSVLANPPLPGQEVISKLLPKKGGPFVKDIHLHDGVHLFFTKEQAERWPDSIPTKAYKLFSILFPEIQKNIEATTDVYLGDLAKYVLEFKRTNGNVDPRIEDSAKGALRQLLSVQDNKNWWFYADRWKVPPYAQDRLKLAVNQLTEMMRKNGSLK